MQKSLEEEGEVRPNVSDKSSHGAFGRGAAWIDGKIVPIDSAKLSILDYGFIRSDVTYDTIAVIDGAFFRLGDHLNRFSNSCKTFRIDHGVDRATLIDGLCRTVAASGLRDAVASVVATRGVNLVKGSRDPRDCDNNVFVWCAPYTRIIPTSVMIRGPRLWIAKQVRRIPDTSINQRAKNYHSGDLIAGDLEARDRGFDTTCLLDHEGNLAEGPGFNIFMVKDGRLVTPVRHCLHGITRQTILDIALEEGIETECRALPLEEFLDADEVFISSTAGGPCPIVQVDDRVFFNGVEGPVSCHLRRAYWDFVKRPEHRTSIEYG